MYIVHPTGKNSLQENKRKDFVCNSFAEAVSQSDALEELFTHSDKSVKEKLLCHIQFWCSLNRLADSGKLAADQVKAARKSKLHILNDIGGLYFELSESRWALACYFYGLYEYE